MFLRAVNWKGIPSDKLEEAVEEKIEEMGLRQYCERPAGGYSGGNKRKLSVAIAMIGDPQVINRVVRCFGECFIVTMRIFVGDGPCKGLPTWKEGGFGGISPFV